MEWVNIEDRLPPKGQEVLGLFWGNIQVICYRTSCGWNNDADEPESTPYYWMLLPEPPNGT